MSPKIPVMPSLTLGLTKPQIATVGAVFIFTLIGAVALAWALRRWNSRYRLA